MNLEQTTDSGVRVDRRTCLREPIPEIILAAKLLDAAVSAHLCGEKELAAYLIGKADIPAIGDWAYSVRGKFTEYNRPLFIDRSQPRLDSANDRMPSTAMERALEERDGFRCRFCGLPVIARRVRKVLIAHYPGVIRWGDRNNAKHRALDILEIQYDHLLPHSRGGANTIDNLVVTCNPCNYGRSGYTLDEMGLADPFLRKPIASEWDGLARLLNVDSGASI